MNDITENLTAIWKEVCEVDTVTPTDNFFELGGSSAQIIQLFELVNISYPDAISVAEIFSNPTIELLTVAISERINAGQNKSIENFEF
jgi:acyl carrier protein